MIIWGLYIHQTSLSKDTFFETFAPLQIGGKQIKS